MLMLKERKVDVVKELEKLYSTKQVSLSVFGQKVKESNDKIEQVVTFIEKWVQTASTKELLMFQASLEFKMAMLLSQLPKLDLASTVQLEFISNFQSDKNDDDADFKIIVTVKKLWKQVQEDGVISNGSNNNGNGLHYTAAEFAPVMGPL